MKSVRKLGLGTAQFGLDYGISNKIGKPKLKDIEDALQLAYKNKIKTLDTAVAYGDAESRLGEIGIKQYHVVTKIGCPPAEVIDAGEWTADQINTSLERLKIDQLHGILLHDTSVLNTRRGVGMINQLIQEKEDGRVCKIGVSIYSNEDLQRARDFFDVAIVQLPYNVLDQRFRLNGTLQSLANDGIEVHTRSAFLQGLLLMRSDERPHQFQKWSELWCRWDEWLRESNTSALDACLKFCLSNTHIDKVIVGVQDVGQLSQIINATNSRTADLPADLACEDTDLINPSNWVHK